MHTETTNSIRDSNDVLSNPDHMDGMQHLDMVVERIDHPFASVARVTGKISPADPAQWRIPNLAVRVDVEQSAGARPVSRVYTVRQFHEALSLIEIDFVIHVDDSPAMRWLSNIKVGHSVSLTGPRPHFVPNYSSGKPVAIFADETAIPAVYAILKQWPTGLAGCLFVETRDQAAFDELPLVQTIKPHLFVRNEGQAAGATGWLVNAAKTVSSPIEWTVWAAGERQEARAIRKYFLDECGLQKNDVRVFGYWRKGVSSSDIDRMRLKHYENLQSIGNRLENFEDFDVPV